MYNRGDKIVYPIYGAGVIESLEEKEVDGTMQSYYVMRIPIGNLKIIVSVGKADSLGIREIYTAEQITAIINNVNALPKDMPENWNQRYKENMGRIKSGKLEEVTLVYRNLRERERKRGLSTAEKKIMTTAKQIVLSELILSQNLEKPQAEDILLETLNLNFDPEHNKNPENTINTENPENDENDENDEDTENVD
ncbi:MAG: CarD family transcriptional regulator [Defluviitaleaceae bacterium]|nr:CarD family transcriptional regulator [Defluviitaleaceae bacterium]